MSTYYYNFFIHAEYFTLILISSLLMFLANRINDFVLWCAISSLMWEECVKAIHSEKNHMTFSS